MRHRIFWITKRITQGQFATSERAVALSEQGITHVLNVGEGGSIIEASKFGLKEVIDIPIVDLQPIPLETALRAVDEIHRMLSVTDSIVFIHCIAGQNRSPTILWLYFIACGLCPGEAQKLIADRSPDAIPGHGKLINASLVENIKSHGEINFIPISDNAILEPAY